MFRGGAFFPDTVYNGGNTRESKHRHFVFDTLLDLGKLE